MNCPICDGEGVPLGELGNREHFRCRACGADFSTIIVETPPVPQRDALPLPLPASLGRPTRAAFLEAYRAELEARYAWALDAHRLAKFMDSVTNTLNGGATWNKDGEAVEAAWKKIGGKGKVTYKALRALEN